MGKNMKWSARMQEMKCKRNRNQEKKWKISVLPIGDPLDSQSTLLELQEVITFGKRDVRLIAEVRLEGFVPKENPPVINILTRTQDSLWCVPIDIDGEVVLKFFNLDRNFFFQLKWGRERESEIRYETRRIWTKLRRLRNGYTWAQNDALWSQSSKAFSLIGLSMGNLFSDLSRMEAFHQWSHLALNEASTGQVTIFCNFSIVMSVEANSLKCLSICARPKKWNEFKKYPNGRIIHVEGNMEVKKEYLVKEILPIVRMCDRDIFFKWARPNALNCPLLGFGHDIPNFRSSPLGNRSGFTVMPHCKVSLSRNVSLQKMTL